MITICPILAFTPMVIASLLVRLLITSFSAQG